jgi:hypothetical protein
VLAAQRQRAAVSDMGGGLVDASATAATVDPTASLTVSQNAQATPTQTQSYQQGNMRVEVRLPTPSKPTLSAAAGAAPDEIPLTHVSESSLQSPGVAAALARQLSMEALAGGSKAQPVELSDDESMAGDGDSEGGSGSDTDSDDGDIPAVLPPLQKTPQRAVASTR